MRKGIFVIGTDTGVGKTLISVALILGFKRRGYTVSSFKPFETGCRMTLDGITGEDGLFLAELSGEGRHISGYKYMLPAAPYHAAKASGEVIEPEKLLRLFEEGAEKSGIIVCEGAGGILVPLTEDYMLSDFVRQTGLPAVIVARSSLGTINHTLLTYKTAEACGINVLGVIFNDAACDSTGERVREENIKFLGEKMPLLGRVPYMTTDECGLEGLKKKAESALKLLDMELLVKRLA